MIPNAIDTSNDNRNFGIFPKPKICLESQSGTCLRK